ncbi:hypothetical protein FIBSPDRAFT_959152 [Athelia psychrophila]|nr:hypothetical protein FIBSPDRAFT_959152 [Fibularhizoctonia sp. CBS 109695]
MSTKTVAFIAAKLTASGLIIPPATAVCKTKLHHIQYWNDALAVAQAHVQSTATAAAAANRKPTSPLRSLPNSPTANPGASAPSTPPARSVTPPGSGASNRSRSHSLKRPAEDTADGPESRKKARRAGKLHGYNSDDDDL